MAADGQIVFEISADGKSAIASVKDVTEAIRRESGKWEDSAQNSTSGIESSFTGMAKKIAAGISAAGIAKALLDIGKAAVDAASDLAEVQNVVDVTFGDNAAQIESWAKKAGAQFGLTETKAKQFTSTLGAMMKSAGLSGNEIVSMSTDLAGLAADMASFYNLDFETAFQKIRSGISGETEPLKQLGVNMSVANLEAYALSKGLGKTFNEMSQGEQTMLRYQYLMQATADAQGDFARTSDGFANAQRRIEASVDTIKTSLGQGLLPVVESVTSGLADMLSKLTAQPSRTVIDEFNDIDVKTEDKLASINSTAEKARELVGVLESIKTSTVGKDVQKIANDLAGIDLKQDKTKILQEFLGTLNNNISEISAVSGQSADGVKAWLAGVEEKAKSLSPDDITGWQDLINTITAGIPGLENTTAGKALLENLLGIENTKAGTKVQELATELGKIDTSQGKIGTVQEMLGILRNNIDALTEISGEDASGVEAWLSGIEAEAAKLDPEDVSGWNSLVSTITGGIPGLKDTTVGQQLLQTLQEIARTDASGSVTKLGEELGKIDTTQGKTAVVGDFLDTLRSNVTEISKITGKDAAGVEEWISGIAEAANGLEDGTTADWQTLIALITAGLPGIEDTEGGKSILESLGGQFGALGEEGLQAAGYLEALGIKTDGITDKQQLWLETCKRLVQTIPGLSSIINTETGEVKGGTQAIYDYIQAWQDGQTKIVMMQAHQQKQNALNEKYSELPGLELDKKVAEHRLRKRQADIKALLDKYSMEENELYDIFLNNSDDLTVLQEYMYNRKASKEDINLLYELGDSYEELSRNVRDTTDAYNKQKDAYDEAAEALEYEAQVIEEMPGEINAAGEAMEDFGGRNSAAWQEAVSGAQAALKEMTDYVQGVYDTTESAVNNVIKGFAKVNMAGDELRKKNSENAEEEQKLQKKYKKELKKYTNADGTVDLQRMSANYDKLTKEEQEAYNALAALANKQKEVNDALKAYTPQGMISGLQSQITFMNEYLDNLEKAREMGLSDELLASLSDGSAESAEYLAGLVAGGKDQAQAVDDLYKQVQEKKKEFTKELTDQKLTVDEVYQDLATKAKAAVEELKLGQEAAAASGETVSGIAEGISAHVPEVKTAVDDVLKELDKLSGWGVNIDFGRFGEFSFSLGDIPQHETGLDRVPFDGYLASLHEGEGILTAEENRIWQRFKNGTPSSGTDYDALGGVMRDNIRPGGDVYLDGRTVGHVISARQADSYRSLQRSGWQQ